MDYIDADSIQFRADEVRKLPLGNLIDHLADGRVSSYTAGGRAGAAASIIARDRSAQDVPKLLAAIEQARQEGRREGLLEAAQVVRAYPAALSDHAEHAASILEERARS